MSILIVDDEEVALTSLKRLLKRRGLNNVELCDTGKDAIRRIREENFDLVLLDLLLPETDGMQILEATKPYKPATEFIILTAVDDVQSAVKAVRLGAYDYLVKPVDPERLFLSIERAYEHKGLIAGIGGAALEDVRGEIPEAFQDFITRSPRIKELLRYAEIMARSGNPILVTGESGTGKELLARGIHRASNYAAGPFVPVNVNSIPDSLFESQFFGHVKGAYTGADSTYRGFFEQADGGTLFLDEIGELPRHQQVKFLRVLEDKSIVRLGDSRPLSLDVRIVSATNIDIDKACQQNKFRLDLLYRLKSAHIHLPPLRERATDIPLLAEHFLKKACTRYKKDIHSFSPEAMELLCSKDYPGNVRELAQYVENAAFIAGAPLILPQHLGENHTLLPSFTRGLTSLKENNELHILYVLTHTKGDRQKAAEILGVTKRHVQRKLSEMKQNPRWRALMNDL